jgi:hypothetical protein
MIGFFLACLVGLFLRPYALLKSPDELIGRSDGLYMKRWHLWRNYGKFNIYLHNFKKSDDDRALHDHPWASWSVCIGGNAFEFIHDDSGNEVCDKRVKLGTTVWRDADFAHRMVIPEGEECWTLFITGPKVREWGFLCPTGWKHHQDFIHNNGCGQE